MILTSHAIVGAAVARLFPKYPLVGFFAAVASHIALDAIPHWEYPLRSRLTDPQEAQNFRKRKLSYNIRAIAIDLASVGFDLICGAGLAVLFFAHDWHSFFITMIGAIGGVLPDPLEVLYLMTKSKLLVPLETIHRSLHSKITWVKKHPWFAIPAQAAIVAAIVLFSNYLSSLHI